MIEVVPVLNPDAWSLPFVQRALRSIKCAPEDIDFAAVLDSFEVWLALDPMPSALAILSFSIGPLKAIPSVVHLYSEGNARARGALVAQVVNRIKEEGFSHYLAGNWSGGKDAAWKRLLKDAGIFERVGSTFIVEVPV